MTIDNALHTLTPAALAALYPHLDDAGKAAVAAQLVPYEYVVRVSSAKPKGGWGTYSKVAVMCVDRGYYPHAIDDRPKSVREIVYCTDRLYHGGPGSAAEVAKASAEVDAAERNRCALAEALEAARGETEVAA